MIRVASALFILMFLSAMLHGQDTFSIVAVDTVTREIGSAGASCVGPINGVGAYIISDVVEGIGAIHTQASWLSSNQQTAHQQMLLGKSPQEIIDWMATHDAQGNPTVRQYGVVDLTRRGQSAAYTGVNCLNYKNHAVGPGYAVQGNILLGQMIIDTIKNVYLGTPGPLADRLMKALEAAMIVGADTRCASRNTSTQSAFIKVVRIGNGSTAYLQKIVPDSPVGTDPITLLRTQFNAWKDSLRARVDPYLSRILLDRDTLPANGVSQAVVTIMPKNNSDTLLSSGRMILLTNTGSGMLGTVTDLGNGTYAAILTSPITPGTDTISGRVVSGTDTVRLADRPIVVYRSPSGIKDPESMSTKFSLDQNFPNPFNPVTVIYYLLGSSSHASLKVYDVMGKEVLSLVDGWRNAGRHVVTLDASAIVSGVYYYQLRAADYIATRKMVVLR